MAFPPAEGTVVDGTTDRPVAGAVVVAAWIPYSDLSLEGHRAAEPVSIRETITDNLGRFKITPPEPRFEKPWLYLPKDQPQVLVFRRGYVYAGDYLGQKLLTPYQTSNDAVLSITRTLGIMEHLRTTATPLPRLTNELRADIDGQPATVRDEVTRGAR